MIRFRCKKCTHRLKARDNYVGRKVQCPRCGHQMHVPAKAVMARRRVIRRVALQGSPAPAEPVRFPCRHCGVTLGPEAHIGGRWAKCTACGKIVDLPTGEQGEVRVTVTSAPAVSRPAASSGASPAVSAEGDALLDRFLPPHHEVLPDLMKFDIPDLAVPENEPDYAQPMAEGGYAMELVLKPDRRSLYLVVALMLVVYAAANVYGGIRRWQAGSQIGETGKIPAWMESLTPLPPQLTPQGRIVQVTETRPAAWVTLLGLLFFLMAGLQVTGAWMLVRKHAWAAKWVFFVSIAVFIVEMLDLSVTGTGYVTAFKPIAWAVNVVAIAAVISR